jgi:hypothetical protein
MHAGTCPPVPSGGRNLQRHGRFSTGTRGMVARARHHSVNARRNPGFPIRMRGRRTLDLSGFASLAPGRPFRQ